MESRRQLRSISYAFEPDVELHFISRLTIIELTGSLRATVNKTLHPRLQVVAAAIWTKRIPCWLLVTLSKAPRPRRHTGVDVAYNYAISWFVAYYLLNNLSTILHEAKDTEVLVIVIAQLSLLIWEATL